MPSKTDSATSAKAEIGSDVLSPFPQKRHDHGRCVRDALDEAERTCRASARRLTPLRRLVLELVWSVHAPIGAYDLLDRLREHHPGAQPPTVYRALDFLLACGLVHRIESLNAYVGCGAPGDAHSGQFLICRGCGRVAEMNARGVTKALRFSAAKAGFTVEQETIEIVGLCAACAAEEPQ